MTEHASVAHISYDFNQALESLNGREYVHRGIHGVLHYGGRRFYERLTHDPSSIGKETEAYAVTRRELGDDWSTDLTDCEEAVVAIFEHFGIYYDAEARVWREPAREST